jgi:hypothetical protein
MNSTLAIFSTRQVFSDQGLVGGGRNISEGGDGHHSDHLASREVVGPHSGPYGSRPYRRVRCADQSPLAEVMIKAARGICSLDFGHFCAIYGL